MINPEPTDDKPTPPPPGQGQTPQRIYTDEANLYDESGTTYDQDDSIQ
jgi:hypothetical protein